MAVETKYTLYEKVIFRLEGGDPSSGSKWEPRQIMQYISSVCNKMLKVEYFDVLKTDDTIPDNLVLATYDLVPVTTYKDRSRAELPAIPVKLPRGMGIYHVSDTNYIDCPHIPLLAGQNALLKSQNLINNLFYIPAYEYSDGYIVYTTDITALTTPITQLLIRLVVMDFEKYQDFDILPLPANMSADVVDQVVAMLMPTPPADKRVDSISTEPVNKR